jgi:CRP-like cAMP-binding protein
MTESALALLHRHPFVADLEPAHVETLAALARRVAFEKNEIVFREGDETSDFYLIVSGMVSLEMAAADHTFRVQTVQEGHEFGWSALLMGSGKYFQARALDHVDTLAFNGPALLEVCKANPQFGFVFMQRLLGVVAERLQATRLQLVDMHSPMAKLAGA